jgi:hypothetical protein
MLKVEAVPQSCILQIKIVPVMQYSEITSCVFTECANKSAYHLQPGINCEGNPPPPQLALCGALDVTGWRLFAMAGRIVVEVG